MKYFNDNWDGVKRKSFSFDEAMTNVKAGMKDRNYDHAARNFLEHIKYKSPVLYASFAGRKVFVIVTSHSYEVNAKVKWTAQNDIFCGFCPLDNGNVVSFISHYNIGYNSALWGTITSTLLDKTTARYNYVKLKKDPKFVWEGEIKA
jgi:hypothetical protein